jgi:hypothetical protein
VSNDSYNSLDLKGGRRVSGDDLRNTRTTMRFGDSPRTIWRNPRPTGRAGSAPTFQVIQQADGRLNTRRLAAASPLQTVVNSSPRRRALSKRAGLLLLVLALVALAFFASPILSPRSSDRGTRIWGGAASARAQEIGEPWCQVSAPMLPSQAGLRCIEPRIYLPLIIGGRHGDQSARNHRRAGDSLSVGNHGRASSAIGVNRALLSRDISVANGSGSRLR